MTTAKNEVFLAYPWKLLFTGGGLTFGEGNKNLVRGLLERVFSRWEKMIKSSETYSSEPTKFI